MVSARGKTSVFGNPAVLGSFVASQLASRRKRGPVALRLWLSPDLPLSLYRFSAFLGLRQFWDLLKRRRSKLYVVSESLRLAERMKSTTSS